MPNCVNFKKHHITSLTEQLHLSPLTYLPRPGLVLSSVSLFQHRQKLPGKELLSPVPLTPVPLLGVGDITEPPAQAVADETLLL